MSNLDHLNSWHSDWSELRAVVFGLGVSGFSVADTLTELGAKVIVVADKAEAEPLDILDVLGIECLIGQYSKTVSNRVAEFAAHVVITSPGIKPEHSLLLEAEQSGLEIWTDVDLAWRLRDKFGEPSKWICITGTNGKTTVTQLVEKMLQVAGIRALACGNIGVPILDVIRDPASYEVLVVELSSFQLHYINSIEPVASTVLNLAEDHLDWHGSMEEYGRTKGKIFNNTSICCVYNVGDSKTSQLLAKSSNTDKAQAVGFTVNTPAPNEIGWVEDILVDRAFIDDPSVALELASLTDLNGSLIVSPHLMANIAAAAALVRSIGVQPEEIVKALQEFQLDAHRIQLVLEKDGVIWVDDSKATNPHAAAAALSSFDSVIWIVGGLLKGVDISNLVSRYSSKLKAAIVIGLDRSAVLEALAEHAPNTQVFEVNTEAEDVMSKAVRVAKNMAAEGDVVLLAPAAASMDQFKDYADRGNQFAAAVSREVQE